MTPDQRQKAMNWFNSNRGKWPIKTCYNFVENSMQIVNGQHPYNTRALFEKLWFQEGLHFPHYKKNKDYIFFWQLGDVHEEPYSKTELIEISVFLAEYEPSKDMFAQKGKYTIARHS